MGTAGKVVAVVAVLALAGGAGKHVEQAQKSGSTYGPSDLGGDVGKGADRVAGGVGDATGSALGKSDLAKGAALGAGAYGVAKGSKAWRDRAARPPVPEKDKNPMGAHTDGAPTLTGPPLINVQGVH